MKKESELSVLVSLYTNVLTDITYYQTQGDSTSLMDVVPLVIIPLLELFEVDSFVISIICLFAPLVQCLGLQRSLQAHTFVAMLRGYAADIEESINEILKKNIYLYNSVLIDKYIATDKVVKSKGTKTSWFVMALMHYVMLAICILFFYYYNKDVACWILLIAGIWFVFLVSFITRLCLSFSEKEKKRFDAKELVNVMRKERK